MSVQAMTWAYRQELAPITKFVLVTLANYADAAGGCWPSQEQLAEDCGCSERKLRSALAELEERGLIERTVRRRRDGTRRSDFILLSGFAGQSPTSACDLHPVLEELQPVEKSPDQPANRAGKDPSEEYLYAGAPAKPPEVVDISARLVAACGPGLCAVGRFVIRRTARVIDGWLAAGCDLEADILPVVAARTARVRGSPIRTWAYFGAAVREARERRLRRERQRATPERAPSRRLPGDEVGSRRPSAAAPAPSPQAVARPRANLREVAELYAGWIRSGGWFPGTAVSNTVRDAMLALGLVRAEELRALGIP